MFGRKTTAQEANKDRELLLQAMDKMIAGDFSVVSSEGFSHPIYADKLNQIVGAYKKANNNYIMRLEAEAAVREAAGAIKGILTTTILCDSMRLWNL